MGQAARGVEYVAHAGAATLLLTAIRTSLAIGSGSQPSTVDLTLVGADPAAAVTATYPLPGVVNYLRGRDPGGWRTGIPTFATLTAHGVYPGVDLVRHTSPGGGLADDLLLAPGADPRAVGLRVDGARALSLDPSGDVRIDADGATVIARAPRAEQTAGGARRPVSVRYRLDGDRDLALDVGPHDATAPLRIEPALVVADTPDPLDDPFGSRRFDQAAAIAVDPAGNAYIAGTTASSNFPTTSGAAQTAFHGSTDAFVSKLNPTGTALVYSTYLGGSGFDQAAGIAVDGAGDAYVAGATDSPDFPTTAHAVQPASHGDSDAFVARLNAAGTSLLYSTYLGGDAADAAEAIAVDPTGSACVTGFTRSATFPVTAGAFQTHPGGGDDGFVTRLNPDGTALEYSTYLGGSDLDQPTAIAVDRTGSAYVTGSTSSPDFPVTAGAVERVSHGGGDAFVSKLTPAGSALVYSTFLGGRGDDQASGIAVDAAGDAYVTGQTGSPDFPVTRGAFQTVNHGGGHDAFVTRLGPTGRALLFSTCIGGTGFDLGLAIAVDPSGSALVTGTTSSYDFPVTSNAVQPHSAKGGDDAFVLRVDPTGTALLYSTYLGGGGPDRGNGLAVDPSGIAYVAGVTGSADFPTTQNALQTSASSGGDDAFVTRIDTVSSALRYSTYLGGRSSLDDLVASLVGP